MKCATAQKGFGIPSICYIFYFRFNLYTTNGGTSRSFARSFVHGCALGGATKKRPKQQKRGRAQTQVHLRRKWRGCGGGWWAVGLELGDRTAKRGTSKKNAAKRRDERKKFLC
jgi:hypothetical protein